MDKHNTEDPQRVRTGRSGSPRMSPRHSPRQIPEAQDPGTDCLSTLKECDCRCTLNVGDHIWVGEREGSLTIRDPRTGEVVHIIERRKGAFVWSLVQVRDHVWAGCSDGFIRVLSRHSYRMEKQFARHAGGGGGVMAMTYHPNLNLVFSGSNDFEILAWDATSYEFVRQYSLQCGVRCLLILDNNLISGSDDGLVTVWDIASGKKLQEWSGHSKAVLCMCATDSHVWTGSEDGTIRIWQYSGEAVGVAEVHTGPVSVLTSVGNAVWSGSGDTLCIWDSGKLKLRGTYVEHEGYIDTITPVGRSLDYKVWTTSRDKTCKLWRTEAEDGSVEVERLQQEVLDLKAQLRKHQNNNELIQQLQEENQALKEQLEDGQTRVDGRLKQSEHDHLIAISENARLQQELALKDQEIQELRAELSKAHSSNDKLRTQIHELELALQAAKAEEAKARASELQAKMDLVKLEGEISEASIGSDKRLRDAQLVITELQGKNAELVRLLEDANRTNHKLEAELADTQVALQEVEHKAQHYTTRCSELEDRLNRGQHSHSDLQLALDRAREEIAQLEAERQRAKASRDGLHQAMNEQTAVYNEKVQQLQNKLQEQNDDIQRLSSELAAANVKISRLEQELKHTQTQLERMSPKLGDMTTMYEAKIAGLQTQVLELKQQSEDLKLDAETAIAQRIRVEDELANAYADIQVLTGKLKEMDIIFKSRLSLITDTFKTYKKYEQCDRKLRTLAQSQPILRDYQDQYTVAMNDFKNVISAHFTDDELAHLGSSRHFFPPSPSKGILGSPGTSQRVKI